MEMPIINPEDVENDPNYHPSFKGMDTVTVGIILEDSIANGFEAVLSRETFERLDPRGVHIVQKAKRLDQDVVRCLILLKLENQEAPERVLLDMFVIQYLNLFDLPPYPKHHHVTIKQPFETFINFPGDSNGS